MNRPKKNLLEWAVFGVSIAIITACVALLVHGAISSPADAAPDLNVRTEPAGHSSGGYSVPVTISNRGQATAEQVRIEVALEENGRALEKVELTVAFVPRQSRREGAVVFSRDPRCCTISARTISYETP